MAEWKLIAEDDRTRLERLIDSFSAGSLEGVVLYRLWRARGDEHGIHWEIEWTDTVPVPNGMFLLPVKEA